MKRQSFLIHRPISSRTPIVTWTSPTASDNSGSVTLTSNYDPGDTFPIGETVVRYNATDPDSNAAMSSFTVTIRGNGNQCFLLFKFL